MIDQRVREVADGEELATEGAETHLVDPRERTTELRRLAFEDAGTFRRQTVTTSPAANGPRTEGLTPLDRERAASIADEGGASAAILEAQRVPARAGVRGRG